MNRIKARRWFTGLAALAVGAVWLMPGMPAQEAEQAAAGPGGGQPARAVRLSYVDGQVRLAQGNQELAEQAAANTPLFEGAQLTTTDSGKAEIQFEDGSVARLSPDSSLTLQVLSGSGASADAEIAVTTGLVYFEIQGGGLVGQMNVHFGDSTISASGFTVLRVNLDSPPGQVAVFSGNAHLVGNNGAFSVDMHGGESVALSAADATQYNLAETIDPNSWDAWNSDRDQALTAEAANQTAAPTDLGEGQNPAWNDLDANGNWYNVPDQGYVWSPYDASNPDFDPYGNGNWMWTPGYGYLWLSGYSWGYLPFQCGTWNFYGGFGWGWAPGPGVCRPWWWGGGGYGGPNIGLRPPGYHPILRPILPRRPIGPKPIPMVAVNRNVRVVNGVLPARNRTGPVTISGRTVRPLQTVPARPVYSPPEAFVGTNREAPGRSGPPPVILPPANPRPGYNRPPGWTPPPQNQGEHNFVLPNRTPEPRFGSSGQGSSGGTPPSHPSGGSYSGGGHPSGGGSSGGGNSGGGHPSGGFSGGGHPSGGGSAGGGGGHSGGGGGGGGGGSHGGGGGGGHH